MKGSLKALRVICVVHILLGLDIACAKPASSDPTFRSSQIQASSGPLSSPPAPSGSSQPRRVVTSWSSGDNVWQASARLPSSSQTGGNSAGTSSTKDLTTTGQRMTLDPTNGGRNNRRLHKWEKTEEVSDEQAETDNDEGGGGGSNLAQSLNSMASHLLDNNNGDDQSLENSSERDVFIKNEQQQQDGSSTDQNETDETSSDEDASPTNGPKTDHITTWHDEEMDEQDKMLDKQKSDGNPTTPKGLTTWSAVSGGGGSYIKGSIQKIVPGEHTVSGALSFTTDRLSTANMDFVTKERSTSASTNPTTEIPRTTKAANIPQTSSTLSTAAMLNNPKRRKPYHKNKKVVQPSKFVKPPLAEITAEPIGTDATHTIYKTKVIDPQSKVAGSNDFSYTTKRPQWPYQLPPKAKIVTTKRPVAFSRITAKPKNPYVLKKPGSPNTYTLTTQTTTVPPSTTVYHRNPAPLMYPFPSISFTNLGFMDFLRSQIIPRIGLSLISFMAASPLILSMIGASAVGRRKRSLEDGGLLDTDRVQFEYISKPPNVKDMPKFDFSTIKKKLHKLEMIHHKKPRKSIATQVTEIVSKLMHTKGFSMLKAKFFEAHDSPKDPNVDKSHL